MTTITARRAGICARSGTPIKPGDRIDWNPRTRTAVLVSQPEEARYVSDVFRTSGGTFYRNKRGRCEDAPACGCCTI